MPHFKKFKNRSITKPGFYVLKYKYGPQRFVYATKDDGSNDDWDRSFHVTMINTRDKDTCHDFGEYVWPNHHTGYGPMEWREMSPQEVVEFKKKTKI